MCGRAEEKKSQHSSNTEAGLQRPPFKQDTEPFLIFCFLFSVGLCPPAPLSVHGSVFPASSSPQ